jgi:hypothetical protein
MGSNDIQCLIPKNVSKRMTSQLTTLSMIID